MRQNVAKRVKNKPRVQTLEDVVNNCWNPEEARQFIMHVKATCDAQYTALFALLLDTGMRKSELIALQWKDLEGTTLRVERQVQAANRRFRRLKGIPEEEGKLDTCPPKSKRARRLDLSDETVVLLREHKRQQADEVEESAPLRRPRFDLRTG